MPSAPGSTSGHLPPTGRPVRPGQVRSGHRARGRWYGIVGSPLGEVARARCVARRGAPHGSGLGKTRWLVERTFAWLHQFKRLRIRLEIRADLHQGLLQLACAIIRLRRLRTAWPGQDRQSASVNRACS